MRSNKSGQSLLLAAGFFVMAVICFARIGQVAANELFEEAKVTVGRFCPADLHNGRRVYLYLLHGILILLGNKVLAGAILQMLLQLGATAFFCFTARRMSGASASLAVLAVSCLSPYFLRQAVELSVLWFFLFCYGGCTWLLTEVLESQAQKKDLRLAVKCLATGSLLGFCCYLDPAGITLLAFLVGVFWMPEPWKEKAAVGLGCALAALTMYFGLYGVQAGDTFGTRLLSQWSTFAPGSFPDRFLDGIAGVSWDFMPVAVLALVGVILSVPRKRIRGRACWLIAAVILSVMQLTGFSGVQPVNSFVLLYLFCAALAGCSISDYFYFKESKMDNENKEVKQEGAEGGNGKPRYLENPLPLPKKHVKKVLDFDYDVSDDDDFDHP